MEAQPSARGQRPRTTQPSRRHCSPQPAGPALPRFSAPLTRPVSQAAPPLACINSALPLAPPPKRTRRRPRPPAGRMQTVKRRLMLTRRIRLTHLTPSCKG